VTVLLSLALIGAIGAVAWAVTQVSAALRAMQADARRQRAAQLLALFGPGMAAAGQDARALLSWHPVAVTARTLMPDEFAELDRAAGQPFPFSPALIEQAHARWTADWLEWEQAHTTAYRLKVAEAEAAIAAGVPTGRAQLDAVEREKLELYQTHYSQYVRVAKAMQALMTK